MYFNNDKILLEILHRSENSLRAARDEVDAMVDDCIREGASSESPPAIRRLASRMVRYNELKRIVDRIEAQKKKTEAPVTVKYMTNLLSTFHAQILSQATRLETSTCQMTNMIERDRLVILSELYRDLKEIL